MIGKAAEITQFRISLFHRGGTSQTRRLELPGLGLVRGRAGAGSQVTAGALAWRQGASWLASHTCLMRKQCHLVAIYQSPLDDLCFNFVQKLKDENISFSTLLSLIAQDSTSFARFSKPRAFPSGAPPTAPPPLTVPNLFSGHTAHTTSGALRCKASTHVLLFFECFFIQVFSKITLLPTISGLLPIDVLNQRNFLLSYKDSGCACHLVTLIGHSLSSSYQQIWTLLLPFQ